MKDFIKINKLKPADRIVVPKRGFEIVEHHAIYLGQDRYGKDLITENTVSHGVIIVTANEFFKGITKDIKVKRFLGNEFQRRQAVIEAKLLQGTKYDLINFNCEHYANYVQTKISESKQLNNGVKMIGVGVLLFGFAYLVID